MFARISVQGVDGIKGERKGNGENFQIINLKISLVTRETHSNDLGNQLKNPNEKS